MHTFLTVTGVLAGGALAPAAYAKTLIQKSVKLASDYKADCY
ncbi:hypothetical protein HNQ59_003965 [Chitinivorax tropicus]|uniref:Uncharacterized protein n=1 Tax=Chitinivorax tropicus TaxID=714531 RepID=A0A840MQC6_9PROT|nr:hypothetical protein [Chitinivorax tropicus]